MTAAKPPKAKAKPKAKPKAKAKPAPRKAGARKRATGQRRVGRPSEYSKQIAEAICTLLMEGETLRQIAAREGYPHKATIIRWLARHQEFRTMYAEARDVQADVMADDIMEISDNALNDWMERERQSGEVDIVLNDEAIQRSRLRIDTRKWLMAKMAPKKYGDRVALTGPGGGPLQHEHQAVGAILDELGESGADTGPGASRG